MSSKSVEGKVQELLKPRVKCIGTDFHYPDSPFIIGDILIEDVEDQDNYILYNHERRNPNITAPWRWPHLFKTIEWWEEREASEMPEYVKISKKGKDNYFPYMYGIIFKVKHWSNGFFDFEDDKNVAGRLIDNRELDFEPATKAEYESYLNQKGVEK